MDIRAVIDEVARRHKIRLAEDDPILATVTAVEVVHQLFAEHLKQMVTDVANQATDRLAAEIETGRREIAAEMGAAKAAVSMLITDAGAWSADYLKHASTGAVEDMRLAVTAALDTTKTDARTANVTLSLGCAAVEPGAPATLAVAALNLPRFSSFA